VKDNAIALVRDSDGVGVVGNGLKAFWTVVGRSQWLKNKYHRRRATCYSIFMCLTDCRNRKSYILTVSLSRKFNLKIFEYYRLYKL